MQDLLQIGIDAAREAGAAIRGYYKDQYTVRDKGEDNPLTDADLAAAHRGGRRIYPGQGVPDVVTAR